MKKIHLLLLCLLALCSAACSREEYEPVITIPLEGCEIVLNKIEAGSFLMGSYEGIGDEDELPVRNITITHDYYMGIYEITQQQWHAVMGTNPSSFVGDYLPVETVSWTDAVAFCERLSAISGYDVSLPTEAQWEYAARAGTATKWFFGDDETHYEIYGEADMDVKTYPVGSFAPNPNGLYDIYGNVMEWCLDYYGSEYKTDDVKDPTGYSTGDARVSRGGGWGASPDYCRSGYRNACGENEATDGIGFRIVVN